MNIRGKLITGVIKTTKMKNTVIIRKDYLHYIKKYNRFEKRHKNTPVHVSPAFRVKAGDEIMAGQCRGAAAQFASCFVPQAAFRALPVTLRSEQPRRATIASSAPGVQTPEHAPLAAPRFKHSAHYPLLAGRCRRLCASTCSR